MVYLRFLAVSLGLAGLLSSCASDKGTQVDAGQSATDASRDLPGDTVALDVPDASIGLDLSQVPETYGEDARLDSQGAVDKVAVDTADAGFVASPGEFAQGTFSSAKGGSIPYQLLVPKQTVSQQRYPLVVFLHGMGELGTDNVSQTINFPMEWVTGQNAVDHPAFVLAPQCPPDSSWVDWSYPSADRAVQSAQPTQPTRLVLELVDSLLATYPVDPKRVYVTGTSLGGEGSFEMASRRPDLFAAAVPLCGIADSDTAARVKDIAFWIFHGALDDVNPPVYVKGMVKALNAVGAKVKFTEYPGLGHAIWIRAYAEPGLVSWLFAQAKTP